MKNLFPIILLIIFITCLSTISKGQEPAKMVVFTAPMLPVGQSYHELLDIEFNRATVQEVYMGMHSLYQPETDVPGGNVSGTKTKLITFQTSLSQQVTPTQLLQIAAAIKAILRGDTVPTIPPDPIVIDTVDAELSTFDASWRTGSTTAPHWYKNTIAYSNTVNAVATYKHSAEFTRIEIYGEKVTSHGIAAISIDGGPEVMVDLYSPTRILPALLHTFTVPKGIHEVKIRVTGTKNAASTGTYGLVDFYRITR
jgi:hypothetical protein